MNAIHKTPRSLARLVTAAALATLGTATLATLDAPSAHAGLWCAAPLWVHEWGVHVFAADGTPVAMADLPSYFHTRAHAAVGRTPVREMPADNGIRALPILHFYSPRDRGAPIPVGLEVSFQGGPATAWFPDADLVRTPEEANGPAASAAHARLAADRAKRVPYGPNPALPADPTRQLVWDRLELSPAPPASSAPPAPTTTPWVAAARNLPNALWATRQAEAERFVFYEAATAEKVPLAFTRASDWRADRPSYDLVNQGPDPVHDVLIVHGVGAARSVVAIATLPAHGHHHVRFGAPLDAAAFKAATVGALRAALTDPANPAGAIDPNTRPPECVMGRDPAIPFEHADGARLFAPEVDLILSVWAARFFEQPGTTVVFREDVATLERAMPLSIYTDMATYVQLQRAGLALWENVALP